MCARTVDEPNRTATPRELPFDLAFVAAVARLVARLAQATIGGDTPATVAPFPMTSLA
jgi:hypothetical protein